MNKVFKNVEFTNRVLKNLSNDNNKKRYQKLNKDDKQSATIEEKIY